MARPRNPELRANYKLSIPAPLAAEVDLLLIDPITRKPKYGARSKLIAALLRNWLATYHDGLNVSPAVPTVAELIAD